MYIPKSNLETDPAILYDFMREHNFATLVTQHEGHIAATHLPVMIDTERGVIKAHMARANDQWKSFNGSEALVIFQGPHAYVSPTWYENHPSVPTWNYAAVHVYGVPQIIDDPDVIWSMLNELVKHHEHGRNPEWEMNLPDDFYENRRQAVVVFELPINRIEGKYKLSQNRTEAEQQSVIEHLAQSPYPVEAETADLMAKRRGD